MKTLGLVDQENHATELANRWRRDDEYAAVCEEIRSAVYPDELLAAQPCPNPDRDAVESWFSRTTGQGEDAVRQMAALYIMLCDATPRESKRDQTPQDGRSSSRRASRPQASGGSRRSVHGNASAGEIGPNSVPAPSSEVVDTPPHHHASATSLTPALHIDIQIHISSEASAEQIDQIFKSMAVHLYRNDGTSGR